ncbi:MAG: adenylate/guanylate cyclase domain-containing protein [Nitrospirota bacterium]|nr:adenylate/guanylate cyclase domain-containing protein [Nitrospirota bacterium]
MPNFFQRSSIVHIGVMTLAIWLAVMGVRNQGFLEGLELEAYDWSMRLSSQYTNEAPPITLVTITDQDIQSLGHWPISDEVLAEALTRIQAQGPRVIGVDIYRDLEVPPGRAALNQVLERFPQIMMVMKFGKPEQGGIAGPAILRETDRVGFSDMVVDQDGVVRRGLLFLDDGVTASRSLPFLLALKYLEQDGIKPEPAGDNPDWLKLGHAVFRPFETNDGSYVKADAQGYQFLLNLNRGVHTFPTLSLQTVLAGEINPEVIHDRIVLLGVVSEGVKDYFYTSQCGSLIRCPRVSGIELHGHIVAQLLRDAREGAAPMATLSEGQEIGWIAWWVLGGAVVGFWVRGAWRFSVVVLSGLLVLSSIVVVSITNSWWIPWVPPAVGWVVNAMVVTAFISNREQKDRRAVMALFSRHVSPQVAAAVWEQREQFLEQGRWRPHTQVVSTVFTDLEGFTTVAERMPPNQLWEWLNNYLDTMVKIITDYGGLIDDYYGDMIKAGFGVLTREQSEEDIRRHARAAVTCSLAMEQEMIRLNRLWQQQGLGLIRMRMGINTGPVMVGSLGSAERLKFTTIGDAVNIAARLENLQKDAWKTEDQNRVCRILLSEMTKQYLGSHPWHLQEVGSVMLKGKINSIRVYRLDSQDGASAQQ